MKTKFFSSRAHLDNELDRDKWIELAPQRCLKTIAMVQQKALAMVQQKALFAPLIPLHSIYISITISPFECNRLI